MLASGWHGSTTSGSGKFPKISSGQSWVGPLFSMGCYFHTLTKDMLLKNVCLVGVEDLLFSLQWHIRVNLSHGSSVVPDSNGHQWPHFLGTIADGLVQVKVTGWRQPWHLLLRLEDLKVASVRDLMCVGIESLSSLLFLYHLYAKVILSHLFLWLFCLQSCAYHSLSSRMELVCIFLALAWYWLFHTFLVSCPPLSSCILFLSKHWLLLRSTYVFVEQLLILMKKILTTSL